MANLIPLIPSPAAKATKVLVIAHRIELINQAKAQISKFNPKLVWIKWMYHNVLGTDYGTRQSTLSKAPTTVILQLPTLLLPLSRASIAKTRRTSPS